jgi:hypothetical protein
MDLSFVPALLFSGLVAVGFWYVYDSTWKPIIKKVKELEKCQ